jgi:hypothetical protein
MSALPIVCDNCGAKYRLPESFSGDKAKCKQCGSVIDVAAQKAAAAAPPPKAAPARPPREAKEPAAQRTAARAPAESRRERPARARRGAEKPPEGAPEGGEDGGRRRRGGERPEQKSHAMLFVGGGVGALAIVAVIVILGMGDPPAGTTDTASNTDATKPPAAAAPAAPDPAPTQPPTQAPAPTPTDAAGDPQKAQPADAASPTAPGTGEKAKDAPTDKPAEPEKAAAAGAPKEPSTPKENWENDKTARLEDVFDPNTLGELTWAAHIDDAAKTEIRALVADVVDGGRAGITAKPKLEKLGYDAVFGLIERLRQLDYKSSEQQMTAWELNKVLEAICAGMNTGFVAVNPGEDLDPRKANFNAKTTVAWGTLLTKYPTKESFDEWRKKRLEQRK